jgi:tetratricopeptide (TPR) repeat protein
MPQEVCHSTASLRGKLLLYFFWLILTGISLHSAAQSPKWKLWSEKGDTLYVHEDYKGAIKLYTKAISKSKLKDKEEYRMFYKRAVCYFSTEEYALALKDIETFSGAYPGVPQSSLLKAFIYREIENDDLQLENLSAAMENQEPGPDLLKWRGLLYLQKSEFEKAKSDLQLARDLKDDPEVETYLGLCFYNLQKKDSALSCFNRSVELDATFMAAYLYAGSLTLEDGDYDLCLKYLNLALRLDPSNKEALYYKGVALIEMEKVTEGCSCLNRAFYAGMDDAGDYLEEYCFGN